MNPIQADYDKARQQGPYAPADTGAQLGQGAAAPAANPNWGEFGKVTSIGKGHPDFEKMRERLAAEDGVRPEQIDDNDVMANYYANAKARYGKSIGRDDLSDDDFMAALRTNPEQGGRPGAAPDTNWAQDFRRFYKRNTNTGTVDVGVPIDPGRVAADGLAPQLGTLAAAKALGTKAPGLLPVTFALDGLDQFGWNPFTDRFGKGTLGHDEVVRGAEQHAKQPLPLNMLNSLGKPITTIREGGQLSYEAGKDLNKADSDFRSTLDMERKYRGDKEPDIMPASPSEYFFKQRPGGGYDKRTPGEALQHLHDKAWKDSKIPGLNYVYALAEADAEGGTQLLDQWRRKEDWRAWANKREADLQAQIAAGGPNGVTAKTQLDALREQKEELKGSVPENIYNNWDKPVAKPFDVAKGDFHMPWQDTQNSRTVGTIVGDNLSAAGKAINPLNWFDD